MSVRTPTVIDYSSRDYASIRQSLLAYAASSMPDWKGAREPVDPNDFGVALVELMAYEGDILSYYMDRQANEAFLATATQRSSVLTHARLLNYVPRTATAATATMTVTATATDGVTLPAGFQFSTAADEGYQPLVFELINDLVIPADPSQQVITGVNVVEGVTVEDEIVGTSCGDLDATFTLAQTPVIADSVVIRIVEGPEDPGRVWYPVVNLLDVSASENAYSYSLGSDDSLTLRFGNNVNGRVPPRGAVIHAWYRVGGGTDGNVDAGTIVDLVNPADILLPVGGATPVINAVNPAAATGGTDSESLDTIRENVPKAVRANDRAISLVDHEALALTIPTVQIAKAKAVGRVYTNITLFIAQPGGTVPDSSTLAAVVDYFSTRKVAGTTLVAATPNFVNVDLELQVGVDPRYSQSLVRQLVAAAMDNLFAFDNVDFAQRVALSDVYTAARNVEGVESISVSKHVRAGGSGAADIVLLDNEIPRKGTFTIRATGGVVNSGSSSSTATPGTPGAPTIDLLRCDPNSSHIELHWTATADTTAYDLLVSYLNAASIVVTSLTAGPYTGTTAVIDLPLTGLSTVTQISLRVRSYNGVVGPVTGAATTTAYTCG